MKRTTNGRRKIPTSAYRIFRRVYPGQPCTYVRCRLLEWGRKVEIIVLERIGIKDASNIVRQHVLTKGLVEQGTT
jgi:hypothetical protein